MTADDDSGTKRELEELLTLHEVEPALVEVIVEGRTDAGVYQTFLDEYGVEAAVYAIVDRIAYPAEIVEELEENNGNRAQVVLAAKAARGRAIGSSLTFVIDSDFRLLEENAESLSKVSHLLCTDYGSLECYTLTENVIRRLLKIPLRADNSVTSVQVLEGVLDALVDIFLCRWVLSKLDNPPKLVERLDKRYVMRGGQVKVDVVRLLQDSMSGARRSRSGVHVSAEILAEEVNELRRKVKPDLRRFVRGHDIAKVLIFFLLKTAPKLFRENRRVFKQADTMEFALLCCLDFHELRQEALFSRLIERLSNAG